jgi:hypothetical protein
MRILILPESFRFLFQIMSIPEEYMVKARPSKLYVPARKLRIREGQPSIVPRRCHDLGTRSHDF